MLYKKKNPTFVLNCYCIYDVDGKNDKILGQASHFIILFQLTNSN